MDNATADIGIFLMLGALRQAHIPYTALHEGKWRGDAPLGHDPKDKVFGVLGMGGIGRVRTDFGADSSHFHESATQLEGM